MTPEQEQERFSIGGTDFEDSLRRVRVGGPEADERGEAVANASALVDRELTDEEVLEIWDTTIAGVSDGSLQTFSDKRALFEDVSRRLGR